MAARSELTPRRILGLRAGGFEVVGIGLFVSLIGWARLIGRLTARDPLPMVLLLAATGMPAGPITHRFRSVRRPVWSGLSCFWGSLSRRSSGCSRTVGAAVARSPWPRWR
jgi:hypothetical protein